MNYFEIYIFLYVLYEFHIYNIAFQFMLNLAEHPRKRTRVTTVESPINILRLSIEIKKLDNH